jgi:hypothetical protein
MKAMWVMAAVLAASGAEAHVAERPPSPAPERPDRRAETAADVALLLGLDAWQQAALAAFLASAPPPPGPPPGPPSGADRGPPPPPPLPPGIGFLPMLEGPPGRPSDPERMAAGRAFWASLAAEQRERLDALARLRAGPFGGPPPMRPRPGRE